MNIQRQVIRIRGVVQGVGFRPFVWRLAHELNCTGLVCNDAFGVYIELQGSQENITKFLTRLVDEVPVGAAIQELNVALGQPKAQEHDFVITDSLLDDRPTALVAPDIAPCEACLLELEHSANRRFHYPFINCTHCGPRFTIIRSLPYDRQRTTMAGFPLCVNCQTEYESPVDRRFHAEPNACPHCGPRIWFSEAAESLIAEFTDAITHIEDERRRTDQAISEVQARIARGQIIAIKGIGGFHLACDAAQEAAVQRLRTRKQRRDKPLAIMVRDLETCRSIAHVSDAEAQLLTSRERPIVLLRKRMGDGWLDTVAPGNPWIGIMLPYSPLHFLLLRAGQYWVMTSGNLSDEPIAFENSEAWSRLKPLVDGFLFHNRPINVPCDDSVVMHSASDVRPIRRSRGYAPLPISLKAVCPQGVDTDPSAAHPSVLAVGGELKSTVCLTHSSRAFISQHVGDLGNVESLQMLDRMVKQLTELYQAQPQAIASDQHPAYLSVQWAERLAQRLSLPQIKVQHHHAHAAALIAEHGLASDQQIIACVFDGTGWGTDGTIWGGEWLIASCCASERFAHLCPTPLPGGDACILRPARTALAALFHYQIPWDLALAPVQTLEPVHRRLLQQQLDKGIFAVGCSSMGRLFDAVAALVGLRQEIHYEGQAAIELESHARQAIETDDRELTAYSFQWRPGQTWSLHCGEMFKQIILDLSAERSAGYIGARFHLSIAEANLQICVQARSERQINRVGLTGGVFQNELLTKLVRERLEQHQFEVLCHRMVPTNDAGISLGQAVVAREACRVNFSKSR